MRLFLHFLYGYVIEPPVNLVYNDKKSIMRFERNIL